MVYFDLADSLPLTPPGKPTWLWIECVSLTSLLKHLLLNKTLQNHFVLLLHSRSNFWDCGCWRMEETRSADQTKKGILRTKTACLQCRQLHTINESDCYRVIYSLVGSGGPWSRSVHSCTLHCRGYWDSFTVNLGYVDTFLETGSAFLSQDLWMDN